MVSYNSSVTSSLAMLPCYPVNGFVRLSKCRPLNIESLVDEELWARYYSYQEDILSRMREAQQVADSIADMVRRRADDSSDYA
jgi:hypothetical protein